MPKPAADQNHKYNIFRTMCIFDWVNIPQLNSSDVMSSACINKTDMENVQKQTYPGIKCYVINTH